MSIEARADVPGRFWVRVDCYLNAEDLTQACHTVMDALANTGIDACYLNDGGPAANPFQEAPK